MATPTVSVIIPTYNRAALLIDAIKSVLAQTYRDFEIIVVDDGSTSSLQAALQDARLLSSIQFVSQQNAGLSAARNHGIRLANGRYITFLDDDDLYREDKLAKQVAYFDKNPAAYIVHSWFSKFSSMRNDLGVRRTSWFRGNIYPQILGQWSILMAAPCVMVERSVFEKVGLFDDGLRTAEDLDMWRRIAREYPFHVIEEPLVRIRQQERSMSSDKSRSSEGFRVMLEKAFADDPELQDSAKNQYLSNMYVKSAQNLLGNGSAAQMNQVRADCMSALAAQPWQLAALGTWLLSFLPAGLRGWLAGGLRTARFRPSRSI